MWKESSTTPGDVVVDELVSYLDRVLPGPPARVLEVGPGSPGLAQRLQAAGYRISVVDRDAEAVRLAQNGGVPGVHADFCDYEGGPFDVVLFTRSLHHIDDLEGAVERARALLVPGGRLVIDEFAREAADEASAAFFYGLQSVLTAAGVMSDDQLASDDSGGETDALERWREAHSGSHGHGLHEGAAMLVAVQGRFPAVHVERTSYLYRYLAQRVEQTERGCRVVRHLLDLERQMIAAHAIRPVGLRIHALLKS